MWGYMTCGDNDMWGYMTCGVHDMWGYMTCGDKGLRKYFCPHHCTISKRIGKQHV